jgi:hypothetical protein
MGAEPEHEVGMFLFQGPPKSPHTKGVKFPTVVSVECLGCPGAKFHFRKVYSPKQVQYFLIVLSFNTRPRRDLGHDLSACRVDL